MKNNRFIKSSEVASILSRKGFNVKSYEKQIHIEYACGCCGHREKHKGFIVEASKGELEALGFISSSPEMYLG
jgi:hypothetical protein